VFCFSSKTKKPMVMTIATPEIISAMLAHLLSLEDMFNDSGFDGIDVASKQSQIEYSRFGSLADLFTNFSLMSPFPKSGRLPHSTCSTIFGSQFAIDLVNNRFK
jgi:hypothetical protein